jgi:hypothetical protein
MSQELETQDKADSVSNCGSYDYDAESYHGDYDYDAIEEYEMPEESHPSYTQLRVSVGLLLKNERYTIVRKLGWGSYSIVWLAWDKK